MPANIVKLRDLCEHITVGFVGSMSKFFVDEGVPLLRGQNIKPYQLDLENLKFIPREIHEKWEKSALKGGDVVIVRVGYPGTACVIPEGLGNLNAASLVIVRPRPTHLSSQYLCYVINSPWGKSTINGRLVGVAQQVFNTNTAAELELPVPPLPTQRKIAATLSAYDDLIENNLRRIKILEEMAQTLYREWFVKFHFAGHQKVKMVDSPLGKIPEGWEVSTVGDIITVVPRKNKIQTGSYLTDGVIPVIDQGKDFIAGYIDDTSLAYDGPLPIIVFGDHTCVLKWVDFRFAVGADGTQLIQPEYPEKLPPRFLFYTLQFVSLEQFGYQRHFKYLKEAKILVPSCNLTRKFEEVVSSNTDLILSLQQQNLNLRQTRDLLLPKLIFGELDVSELDITIPEANA